MMEEGSMMPGGRELGDVAMVGAIDEEKVTVLIVMVRSTCTSDVVIYILRRIVPFSPELAVMPRPLPLGFSPVFLNPVTLLTSPTWKAMESNRFPHVFRKKKG
jgi:hypothetical protein